MIFLSQIYAVHKQFETVSLKGKTGANEMTDFPPEKIKKGYRTGHQVRH